jgi:predicted dehydrogenase
MERQLSYEGTGSIVEKHRVKTRAAAKDTKVGIGLIGCGGMGRWLAAKVLTQNPRLDIRGLADPDSRSIDTSLRQFNPTATVYRDYRELCAASDIDWVMIASWNCYHREHAVAALQAGKHVFCQKPLATTVADCLAMRRAWQKSGRMFNIGFSLRYTPHYQAIRRLVNEGAIGQIVSLEFNETLSFNHGGYIMGDWRRLTKYAGTHLLEKCCHDIDLVNWITGSRAQRVASFGGLNFFIPKNVRRIRELGRNRKGQPAYQTWAGLVNKNPFTAAKDIVDNQVAVIEFENNVRATFHTNCNSGIPERRMCLIGTEGAIRSDVVNGQIEVGRIGFHQKVRTLHTIITGSHAGGDDVLARELAASMLKGTPPAVGLDDGLLSAFTCFGIDKAMESGKVVDMAPFWRRISAPSFS